MSYPAAWITLGLLVLVSLGLLLSGMLTVSWDGNALKVSHRRRTSREEPEERPVEHVLKLAVCTFSLD